MTDRTRRGPFPLKASHVPLSRRTGQHLSVFSASDEEISPRVRTYRKCSAGLYSASRSSGFPPDPPESAAEVQADFRLSGGVSSSLGAIWSASAFRPLSPPRFRLWLPMIFPRHLPGAGKTATAVLQRQGGHFLPSLVADGRWRWSFSAVRYQIRGRLVSLWWWPLGGEGKRRGPGRPIVCWSTALAGDYRHSISTPACLKDGNVSSWITSPRGGQSNPPLFPGIIPSDDMSFEETFFCEIKEISKFNPYKTRATIAFNFLKKITDRLEFLNIIFSSVSFCYKSPSPYLETKSSKLTTFLV